MAKKKPESDQKGRLVEEIAAMLHRGTGVEIQTRVKLPAQHDPSRLREIDVLLSSQVAGYPLRFAIECKNEKKPISMEKVDAFISKLRDVGIPPQLGIYVTAGRYTGGAIGRAKKDGLRLLELRGLTSDRLGAAVQEALQSLVFLLPEMSTMTRFDDFHPGRPNRFPPNMLHEVIDSMPKHGFGMATILDRLWHLWMSGRIPQTAGDHYCAFDLPAGFTILANDDILKDLGAIATVKVTAIVLSFRGRAKQLALVNAESKTLEKVHVDADFRDMPKLVPARVFHTEEELESYWREGPHVQLTTRIAIPRLVQQSFYWPISRQAAERFKRLKADGKPIDFATVEGLDFGRAWEYFESIEDDGESPPTEST